MWGSEVLVGLQSHPVDAYVHLYWQCLSNRLRVKVHRQWMVQMGCLNAHGWLDAMVETIWKYLVSIASTKKKAKIKPESCNCVSRTISFFGKVGLDVSFMMPSMRPICWCFEQSPFLSRCRSWVNTKEGSTWVLASLPTSTLRRQSSCSSWKQQMETQQMNYE